MPPASPCLTFIEGFSNTHRRHSALGYLSPAAYERRWTLSQQVTSLFAVHQTGATPNVSPEPSEPTTLFGNDTTVDDGAIRWSIRPEEQADWLLVWLTT